MSSPAKSDSLPIVCLNGRFVPASEAKVSIFDRSFMLGDGAFETTRIMNGCPLNWWAHWRRIANTARWLGIRLPMTPAFAQKTIASLLRRNHTRDAFVRLQLSRGCGRRGYSPAGADVPTWVVTLHPAATIVPGKPGASRLAICPFAVSITDQLIRHKSASRLLNVLAKADAEARGFDDALFLDQRGCVLEAISSSFYWIRRGGIFTAPLTHGLLPGITRTEISRLCKRLRIPFAERSAPLAEARKADAAFLSVGTDGIKTVSQLGDRAFSPHPSIDRLHAALVECWQRQAARFTARRNRS